MHQQALSRIFFFFFGFPTSYGRLFGEYLPNPTYMTSIQISKRGREVERKCQRLGVWRVVYSGWGIDVRLPPPLGNTCIICIRRHASGALDIPFLFSFLLSIVVLSGQCRERSSKVLGGCRLSCRTGLGLSGLLGLSRRTSLGGLLSGFD